MKKLTLISIFLLLFLGACAQRTETPVEEYKRLREEAGMKDYSDMSDEEMIKEIQEIVDTTNQS